jgi:DNA-binding response OmpR family regulator
VPGGGETLLLVDDDPALLRGLATALRRRGYRVIEASGAGDALLAAELHPGRIDLLVTEVSLPRLDGLQVARRLGARDPGIGMLFLAGAESGLPEVAPCLLKPFTPAALVRRVRAVLDGRG